ncbi:MAG: TolC family protein, partial [Campylobacteraceae bacterium]|nr:TolC family protein [Campylobacteraceae bacterium]
MKYILIKTILVFLSLFSLLKAEHKNDLIQEKRIYKFMSSLDLNKSISKSEIPSYVLINKKRVSYIDSETKDINKFQKVKLIDVVLESISNSDLLKAAREKVVQTQLRHENAKSGFYPTLKAQYSMSKTRHTPGPEGKAGVNGEEAEPDQKYESWNDRSYKITLKQNLFAGGANYYDIKSIYEKLEVAKNQYKITLNDEIKKATKAYFGVVFSNRSVIVNERNFKKLNKILQITTIKYENGALSLGDITSIKANVANAKTKLLKVKSKFLQAIKYYEYIVGINFVKTLPYEKNFDIEFPNFDSLYKRSLAQNKNLINYYKSISAEKYRLKNAKAIFSPTLDFTLSYERLLENKDFEKDSFEQTGDLVGELKLSYNIYNGGVDKNKVLKSLSIIRELNYKLNEEIRKIKWNLSKLYTSVSSVKEALKSNTNEVISSREMVRANWESFELGEKDLQTLLQGQRQLNKAELELVHHEKSFANDFFTILDLSGDLSSFFDLDPDKSKFIDFNKSYYKDITYVQTDNIKLKKQKDLNVILEAKAKEKIDIEKKSILENIKDFIDKFLKFKENTY